MKYENDFLLKLYKGLLETRLLEIKLTDLYAESRVPGHIHSGAGQEAAFVGVLSTNPAEEPENIVCISTKVFGKLVIVLPCKFVNLEPIPQSSKCS